MLYTWLGIIILLTFVEITTVDLVSIWFIAGSILALITSIFTDNVLIQVAIFTISSVILLITTRPILKKIFTPENIKLNIDRVIGMTGIVTEDIDVSNGEVKVDGKLWTAYADKKIKKGEPIKVLAIDGVKLKVEKVEE